MKETFTANFAGKEISIKMNYVAGQANGAYVCYGDTVVLVTAAAQASRREGGDFLPLTVDYQEMTSAAGKIPGGFFKREGRPNEKETLTSRFIDRSIRPLFPKGYNSETQIVATVFSYDSDSGSDIAAMLGASAALTVSDIPFNGPIAGVRIGKDGDTLLCNPPLDVMEKSDLDLFMVGKKGETDSATGEYRIDLVMVEGSSDEISEDKVIEAINFGLKSIRPIIDLQDEMRRAVGKIKQNIAITEEGEDLRQTVELRSAEEFTRAYRIPKKQERYQELDRIRKAVIDDMESDDAARNAQLASIIDAVEKNILRNMIINEGVRIDGRFHTDIRPITCEVGVLPRTHGSAIFTRGETQAMVILTLGTSSDEQRMDSIGGEELRTFMLHYNFPPYSVGEVRSLRSPGRREIGHGALARRALLPVVPLTEKFPYTIRVVSDILSSNGSSSMATVCGGTLALLDGGVPIKEMVAGIAMGLLKEGEKIVILSDILGDEDHAGDMDFKVCGTRNGITAMQMDIKIDGITEEILRKALYQARNGRFHILDTMEQTISMPRPELSTYAPRITTLKINPERIRDVIGTGGKNIRHIISETGVVIDVEDDGTVTIASSDSQATVKAIAMVKALTEEAEVGKIYTGIVKRVVDFGAFVEILPGTDGLVHISQLENRRVSKVTDVVNEGDTVTVKVIDIDKNGKIRLSRKDALEETKTEP
ncbi:MAG: polyribonucleotide nucleotidyltransferase [Syntrophales bacterium]|jgi:polyribonucleotide nucleotidyltransferase|nr:polyribonucleotide nucleotidyltransferase [Syntrophales bacterium]MDY0045226.1 polyribonucleotide nucleotidyltransferase [Syntrophales bacterium]